MRMTVIGLRSAYIPSFQFEATVMFYRSMLQREGVSASWREHIFDLGGTRLSCVRTGGPEHVPHPIALALTVDRLPSANAIIAAGGKVVDQFSYAASVTEESRIASDPSGNEVCFVLAG